jgi:hypothetical protein
MKLLLTLFFCIGLVSCQTGCQNSTQRTAFNTTASAVTTVDAAMTGWGQYVVAERARIKALPATDQQAASVLLSNKEGRVKAAYDKYVEAMTAALSLAAAGSSGTLSTADAAAALISVIATEKL